MRPSHARSSLPPTWLRVCNRKTGAYSTIRQWRSFSFLSSPRVVFFYTGLLYAQQFHLEQQGCIRRDHPARAARAIAQRCRNDQAAGAADFHACHALVPTANHLSAAQRKLERLAAVLARIEFGAGFAIVVQPAGVMHRHEIAGRCGGAAAFDGVFVLQAAWIGVHVIPFNRYLVSCW